MFALLRRNWVLAGMGGTIFSYGGYHVFFTYLRPFLEHDLALQPAALSSVLLAFGIANCLGTLAAGFVLGKWFRPTLFGVHLALAAVAILLFYVQNRPLNMILVMAWGFLFGFIPVSWSAWIARTLADKAELAGGISVAVTQFSIGLVAAVGGLTFDDFGISGIFLIAVTFLLAAAGLVRGSFTLYAKDREQLP